MQGGHYQASTPRNLGSKSPTPSIANGQQQLHANGRPSLPRIGSTQPPAIPQRDIHVIVRLPYPRPPDAPAPPPQVIWSPEKEKILWKEMSKSWTNFYAIQWDQLSAQLDVPVPYLLHRATVKYEEDLRGLQGIRQGPPSAGPVTSPATDDLQRPRPSFTASSNPLSPNTSTPTPYLLRRPSSSGMSSRSTIIRRNSPPRMPKLNPVLTPVRTGDMSPIASTPSESDDSETERKDAQREEADQLAQKLKDLQKMMGSGAFGFAKARPRPLENSSSRSSIPSINTRSQSGTATATLAKRSANGPSVVPGAMTSGTPTSASAASISAQESSIPDMSPAASASRARQPVRVTRRATSTSTRRSPSTAMSDTPESGGRVGQIRAQEIGSGQVSGSSSFSDISDGDMSASALEDALMSNNFRSTAMSRL
ncbi:Transcription initiation factor IID, 18kD subunit [Ceratobasidium sp. AG-Ba]|nr:Transcription initiation factor IID, 18kD subunit [Ceratobasidium sp. AG-Ba]